MDSYDDLCPRCYRKNNKECRICITQDARRELAREALDRLRRQWDGETGYNAGTFGSWLREIAEEGE